MIRRIATNNIFEDEKRNLPRSRNAVVACSGVSRNVIVIEKKYLNKLHVISVMSARGIACFRGSDTGL